MENRWSHKTYQITDGPKPDSKHFQYYYVVLEGNIKKCNYCVWIVDDALSRFDHSRNFDTIISTQKKTWRKWVMGKIDAGDFGNKVLKFEREGEKEIELSEMREHLSLA